MKTLITLLIAAATVAIGAIVYAFSGIHDVSASSPHSGVISWLLSTTAHASVERRSSDIDVPDLSDASLARAGIKDFDAMCVACHGAPGREPEAVGQGLNPPAPDLAESAAHMQPAELFWVTKNGLKMTGMPAWGATHDDDALWPVVAFITTLGDLDADGYEELLASAAGLGHHAGGHGHGEMTPAEPDHQAAPADDAHDHDAHSHDEQAAEKEEQPDDDGHDHKH